MVKKETKAEKLTPIIEKNYKSINSENLSIKEKKYIAMKLYYRFLEDLKIKSE